MKLLTILFVLVIFLPLVSAAPDEEDDDGCSITNLDECIISPLMDEIKDFISGFTKDLFGSPANPLLGWFKGLLGHEPNFGISIYNGAFHKV